MNIDIKSVLIGVLLTTSIMLVMGFDDHKEESQIGRYMFATGEGNLSIVMDTTNGEFVKLKFGGKIKKEIEKNPNKLD